jgi:CBS domain-containing protein
MTTIQAMQRAPAITAPDATLRHAARRMTAAGAALLPVVAEGRLVGALSALDLLAGMLDAGLDPDQRSVRTLMHPDPPACSPDDSLERVHSLLRRHRLPALPVVESTGRLVGLATLFDIEEALDATTAAGPEPSMVRRVRGEGN